MELGLLVLRVLVGGLFAAHGAQKLFGAFGGHGIGGTAGFFEQLGLRPGKLHAWFAGTAEFAGGLLIALGLVTPFAAAALIAVMTAAVLTAHLPKGFFNADGGFEYNLVLVAALFALAGIGAGEWSLDYALGLDLAGTGWALGALGAGLLGGLGAVLSGRLVRDHAHGHGQQPTAA
jgi:putative oxidoreductase